MMTTSNADVYIDIGTSMVKTTYLHDSAEALTTPDQVDKAPKVYTFPRFAVQQILTAQTEEEMTKEVEHVIYKLYNSKDNPDFPDIIKHKLEEDEYLSILRTMYNIMSNNHRHKSNTDELCPLMLAEKLDCTLLRRKNVIEFAFESLEVPSLYITSTPALSQFAEYRDTGVVVELSESTTQVVCIKDGYPLRNFYDAYDTTGNDITLKYARDLTGYEMASLPPLTQFMVVLARDGLCSVNDFPQLKEFSSTGKELEELMKMEYLPEGQDSLIERIKDTIAGVQSKIGADASAFDSLTICGSVASLGDIDSKIITELNNRNDKCLTKLTPRTTSYGHLAPVIGARMLAALPGFKNVMFSHATYYEYGAEYLTARVV